MYFLINEKHKIVFGWSAKAGCSHVKNMFRFYSDIKPPKDPHADSYNEFPSNGSKYTTIIFTRNPHARLVSGFLEKYCSEKYKSNININSLTFRKFVNELYNNGFDWIDEHHFTPQFKEEYNNNIHINHIFDITNIDYNTLDKLFKKTLPEEFKNNHGTHKTNYNDTISFAGDTPAKKVLLQSPNYKCFYDYDIYEKTNEIYKDDINILQNYLLLP